MERDAQFVEMVVKELVENPTDVKVERTVDEMGVLVTLWVNPADMGKVIGKEGRTAKAIRTLLRVIGAKSNAHVTLKIAEPEGGSAFEASTANESTGSVTEMPVEPTDTPAPTAVPSDGFSEPNTPIEPQQPEEENPTSIL